MKNLSEQRAEFIEKSIPYICKKGFSKEAMQDVSEALGKEIIYYRILFPDITEIVECFEHMEDARMLKKIGKKKEGSSTTLHIGEMLKYRIKEISGGKEMLLRLKEYYFSVKHISEGPKAIWRTSDVIWKAAGDKSLDMNYYSKRFLLSSVYTMSLRHYLSRDNENIDEFIAKSLDKVVKIAGRLKLPKMEDIPIVRLFS